MIFQPFGKQNLSELDDANLSKVVGNDGLSVVYDHDTGKYTFSTSLVAEIIQPSVDSTTAIQFQNVAGDAVLTIDTTNKALLSTRGTDSSNFFLGSAGNDSLSGTFCVGIGTSAGVASTTGVNWAAIGAGAGQSNTTGGFWVALGSSSGGANTTGSSWTSIGYRAGYLNVDGASWTAIGRQAGGSNTSGDNWVAIGRDAGGDSTTGSHWTAIGFEAAHSNTTGTYYTAIGYRAGYANITGTNWVAIGREAGRNATGSSCIFLGRQSGYNETASNKLHIANNATLSLIEGTMGSSAAAQSLQVHAAEIIFDDLPTSDPTVSGALWNDSGMMKISAG